MKYLTRIFTDYSLFIFLVVLAMVVIGFTYYQTSISVKSNAVEPAAIDHSAINSIIKDEHNQKIIKKNSYQNHVVIMREITLSNHALSVINEQAG